MKNLHTSSSHNMMRNNNNNNNGSRLNGGLKSSPKLEKASHAKIKTEPISMLGNSNGFMKKVSMDGGVFETKPPKLPRSEHAVKHNHKNDAESKLPVHSIIGIRKDEKPNKPPQSKKKPTKRSSKFDKHHEMLQRIECIDEDQYNHYQKHWFSAGLERLKIEDRSREERLEITRYELRRHLKQLMRCNVGNPAPLPQMYDWKTVIQRQHHQRRRPPQRPTALMQQRDSCEVADCGRPALPAARQCTRHVMCNADQVLFTYCTAKFADNTQCALPVFDVSHDLPLCVEHARKRDNYKQQPKRSRKKPKTSPTIRPPKRTKKKKKPSADAVDAETSSSSTTASLTVPQTTLTPTPTPTPTATPTPTLSASAAASVEDGTTYIETIEVPHPSSILDASDLIAEVAVHGGGGVGGGGGGGVDDMVNQVLALQEPDALELANVDQVLVTQATHLLEETDITNVLNTIQADEFNDFFTVNRNGDYEPSREETEELERALAAVDNDVKSLEKLSQSQGLLDNFLDDHMVESFVQSSIVSDVFHNGFNATCGENLMVGQSSRLLSVQPNSHS